MRPLESTVVTCIDNKSQNKKEFCKIVHNKIHYKVYIVIFSIIIDLFAS